MAVYTVSYDLNVPGQKYNELIAYLKTLDSFHAQKSMWFVNSASTPIQVRTALERFLDANDKLFVSVMIKNGWAYYNMNPAAVWLQARGL
jgi:hypothetical protein